MKLYDIVILTESRFEHPTTLTPYINNLLLEDRLIQEALERRGFRTIRVDWARKDFDWTSAKYALFRTTWDYMYNYTAFKAWFDDTRHKTIFINSAPSIEWNMDKHYFLDLMAKGIHIPTTHYAHKNDNISLKAFYEQAGFEEAVIKPTISGGGKHTYRIDANNLDEYEKTFQEVLTEADMMIQPFLKNVMERGEVSLMVMGGKYTHAVLKVAKKGDFRVQDDWGGSVHPYEPTEQEMAFAEAVVASCGFPLLYARIDIANDNDGNIALIELEIFEPELWFRLYPQAADVLAQAIVEKG
jgi:glutathione synthase/RimK-type ligase-like ATP-grasp enzyme